MNNSIKYPFVFVVFLIFVSGGGAGIHTPAASGAETAGAVSENKGLVPGRDIQYEDTLAPDWKLIWDQARDLSRQGKYGEALVQYELLLERKDNVDEARWEYTLISMHLNRMKQAEKQLEVLLHNDPENGKYLKAEAEICLSSGNLEKSASIYRKLLHYRQSRDEYLLVVQKLATVLEKLENWAELFPLLEKLLAENPGDSNLLKKLTMIAIQLQHHEKAALYLDKLLKVHGEDVESLLLEASLEKQRGDIDKAATSWQQAIALDPDNPEAHRHLQDYYRVEGNSAMELKHVESLLKIDPEQPSLLSRAAELNLLQKRADRALEYYNRYLALVPDDKQVQDKKMAVLQVIAKDLLVLVESEKGRRLWKDLVRVTSDRLSIYRVMADLLRKQGKKESLADVLIILHEEEPGDYVINSELIDLLRELGREEELQRLFPVVKESETAADQVKRQERVAGNGNQAEYSHNHYNNKQED